MTYDAPSRHHETSTSTPADAGLRWRGFIIRRWSRSRRKGAFALMLVLAAFIIMSVAILGLRDMLSASVKENGLAELEFQALHLAECGIAVGLHPQIKPGDPALKQTIGSDSGFEVNIISEGARIPVNYLTDQRFRDIVYNLFILWKVPPQEAETAVDSLADWVDTNDEPRTSGAETDYYKGLGFPDFPRQQGFGSLDEMLLSKGMDAIERVKPDWRNYFSIYGDGLIDLNYAPAEILMAVGDVEETGAEALIRERNGPDGLANTEDDKTVTVAQATQLMGMDSNNAQSLTTLLTTDHLTRRVESSGRIGEKTYKVIVIARRQDDGSLNYLARIEE
jgi:general secretion pathway protein K